MTSQPSQISIVVPVHNEEEMLANMAASLINVLHPLKLSYEIIFIDDGSTDATWQKILDLTSAFPHIFGLQLSRCFGKEAALSAGLDHVRGDLIVVMDGDLQHPPELIPQMLELMETKKADIVDAVKKNRPDQTFLHKLSSRFFNYIFTSLTGYSLSNATDYKLFNRKVLLAWRQMPEKNTFFRGMSSWVGFSHAQIPFQVVPRNTGETKWSFFSLLKLAFTAITSFSSSILHLITLAGLFFAFFAIVLAIQTLYMKFTGASTDGFTTVILLLLIIGSALMLGIGILGEYVARIFEEVKDRPRYIIRNSTESKESYGHQT